MTVTSLLMINMLIYIDQYWFCDGMLHTSKHLFPWGKMTPTSKNKA